MKIKLIASGVAALFVIGITACSPDDTVSEAPQKKSTTKSQPKVDNERKDLLSFELDDRSAYGIDDFWMTWKITNTSSDKSDYSWDWEAVDKATGERLANSTEFETDVQPGQTVKGEMPTTLDTSNVKINITEFDRSASW